MTPPKEPVRETGSAALWIVLARAHRALAGFVEQSVAALGLGLSEFMILEALLHKGPLTISVIGEKVLLTNASMTAAVDRLEERGFVTRQSSEKDRRSKIVSLTKDGRAFITDLYARHVKDIEAVTTSLSQKEQNKLRGLLKTLGLAATEASATKRDAAAETAKGSRA